MALLPTYHSLYTQIVVEGPDDSPPLPRGDLKRIGPHGGREGWFASNLIGRIGEAQIGPSPPRSGCSWCWASSGRC